MSDLLFTWALTILLELIPKKFEINQTQIKGGCQLGRQMVTHNSKSDLPLVVYIFWKDSELRLGEVKEQTNTW